MPDAATPPVTSADGEAAVTDAERHRQAVVVDIRDRQAGDRDAAILDARSCRCRSC